MKKLFYTIIICLFATVGWAVTYTVDGTNGTDAGTCVGASPSTECATIAYVFANEDLDPNDIVEVEQGTYSESINPGSDDVGTSGNQLIIRGKAGDTVTISNVAGKCLDLSGGEDYITVKNFTFDNVPSGGSNGWGVLTDVIGFIGEDITCQGFPSAGSSEWQMWEISGGSNHRYTNVSFDGSGISESANDQFELVGIAGADDIVFDNCTFKDSSHATVWAYDGYSNPSNNLVFRNCTFTNKWRHGLSIGNGNALVEDSTFYDHGIRNSFCPYTADRDRLSPAVYFHSSDNVILRRNKFYNNDMNLYYAVSSGAADRTISNIKIYNNTFYDTVRAEASTESGQAMRSYLYNDNGGGSLTDSDFVNNILWKIEGDPSGRDWRFLVESGGTIGSNSIRYNIIGDATQTVSGQYDTKSGTVVYLEDEHADWIDGTNLGNNPNMVDPDNQDFSLQSTSTEAVDTGTYLTEANGAELGAATATFVVDDARYFYDGWSIPGETADYIYIVGDGTPANVLVQISSINYATNTITLASAQNWDDNADVYLAYSSTVGLMGTAPDIGAEEYALQVHTVFPADGDTDIAVAASATWDYVAAVDDADIWLDKAACIAVACDGSLVSDDNSSKTYDMSTLDVSSTYCLAIRANEGVDQGVCQEFEFTTAGGPPISPGNKANVVHTFSGGNTKRKESGGNWR